MKYRVDESDHAFPRIIRTYAEDPRGQTFAECKRELLEKANRIAAHWREIARQVRVLKPRDVESDVDEGFAKSGYCGHKRMDGAACSKPAGHSGAHGEWL